ncbi:MAG: macro domain-containing protein [Calditrichota bacterium]
MYKVIIEQEINKGKVLKIIEGDITQERVDAIVNAANSYLQHGGGVAGAIVRKGGQIIQAESNEIGFVPTGEAAMTSAGKLPAKYVIHAVGPRWGEGDEDEKLKNAVKNSLKLAEKNNLTSLSMPAISSGIFGFPKEQCANVILKAIKEYASQHPEGSLREIRICLFDQEMAKIFEKIF